MSVSALYRVNGGSDETDAVQCGNCGAWLGRERAVTSTPNGPVFFCKQESGDKPEDSCYLQWARVHPQLLRRH